MFDQGKNKEVGMVQEFYESILGDEFANEIQFKNLSE